MVPLTGEARCSSYMFLTEYTISKRPCKQIEIPITHSKTSKRCDGECTSLGQRSLIDSVEPFLDAEQRKQQNFVLDSSVYRTFGRFYYTYNIVPTLKNIYI